ncbi:MAG: O-antigen ligase family protein [Bacteroidetes bacterium]|nr:O-antigen ligase family protein [Bacteroidota bacterium]
MLKGKWLQPATEYLLCFLALFIPFPFAWSTATIIALTILWLLQGDFATTFNNLRQRKIIWVWLAFFALHAISYTYSENKHESLYDLKGKAFFIVMPIVICCGMQLNRKLIERLFVFFNIGITIMGLFCIAHAAMRAYHIYVTEHYFYHPYFFYDELVDGIDASAVYMAWYTMISVASLFFLPWVYFYKGRGKWLRIILCLFQVIFFMLLSARMLILLFFLFLVPFYLGKLFKHSKLTIPKVTGIILFFAAIAVAIVYTNNPVKKRFNDLFKKDFDIVWLKDYSHTTPNDFSNFTLRLMNWRMGFENIRENNLLWYGAGNGDVQDLQNKKLASYGFNVTSPNPDIRTPYLNMNLHNMYIQTLMMLGIPGLALLIIICFAPLFVYRQIKLKHLFLIFHISAICFLFQEASFQTQAGVVFYSFLSMIFWNIYYNKNDDIVKENSNYVS